MWIEAIVQIVVKLIVQDLQTIGFVGVLTEVVVVNVASDDTASRTGCRIAWRAPFAPGQAAWLTRCPAKVGNLGIDDIHPPAILRQEVAASILDSCINCAGAGVPGDHANAIDQQMAAIGYEPCKGQRAIRRAI